MHRAHHESEAPVPVHAHDLSEGRELPAEGAGAGPGKLPPAPGTLKPNPLARKSARSGSMSIERIIDPRERERAHAEVEYVSFYSEAVQRSATFRKEYAGY